MTALKITLPRIRFQFDSMCEMCFRFQAIRSTTYGLPFTACQAITGVVKEEPFLAALLGLSECFPVMKIDNVMSIASAIVECDCGTQTLTHLEEKHIDINYEWNVWALRRR